MADDPGRGKILASGFEVAAGVGLGAVVGTWIDHHRHSGPWGLLIGLGLGFAAGIYLLIKEAMKSNKD